MSNNINIECFIVQIRRKHENKHLLFREFFLGANVSETPKEQQKKKNKKAFTNFFKKYIESFDGKFNIQKDTNKAIYLPQTEVKFNKEQQVIFGNIKGGITGVFSVIEDPDNPDGDYIFEKTSEHVESMPYFFMLWLPYNSNRGILMIQNYKGVPIISGTLKKHLIVFFKNKYPDNKLEIKNFVTNDRIRDAQKKGKVQSIVLTKNKLPTDKADRLLKHEYREEGTVNISLKVDINKLEKLGNDIMEKVYDKERNKIFTVEEYFDEDLLKEIGISGDYEKSLRIEHNDRTYTAKSSQNFHFEPKFIFEDIEVELDDKNHPIFDSIRDNCYALLSNLKNEINYSE